VTRNDLECHLKLNEAHAIGHKAFVVHKKLRADIHSHENLLVNTLQEL